MNQLPNHGTEPSPQNIEQLEEVLSRPPARLLAALNMIEGDLMLLGVGGKMGPTMARMAQRAFQQNGSSNRVIGVSRFSDPDIRQRLEKWGIETIKCNLLDEQQVSRLPDAKYVMAMSGFKFGIGDNPQLAWATNCYLPALICRRFRDSRIVAFSTGNIYGLVAHSSGGSIETDAPRPDGEYAITALGRERMFEYFSNEQQTPIILLRLNYATELRYGVFVDLAQQLAAGRAVDISMSHFNVIWLADANAMALQAFSHASSPARIVNLAGPEIVATKDVCLRLADFMQCHAEFVGCENDDALLNNGQLGYKLLGRPEVSTDLMLRWTADWVGRGAPTHGKPTHFQTRSGKF
jgi:nucleoside-diphosphate-sugar epimerase